ncbi:MAG: hypothetical protein HGB11_08070 [Chlorobiales bacterium]|nr:hypothetical protein [Chlorobiales bacterium]
MDHNKLKLVVRLQQLDDELDVILDEQKGLPEEISALEEDIASITRQLEVRRKRADENRSRRSLLSGEIAKAQEKINKYKESQKSARNNKEYDSLSKQIEYEEQEIKKAESEVRRIEESETRQAELEEKGRSFVEENRYDEVTEDMMPTDMLEKQLTDVSKEAKHKKDELNRIIEETEDEVKEIQGKIERQRLIISKEAKQILAKYDHLRNGGVLNAVVKLHRHACSGCNTRVPTNRHAFILQGGFYSCESCGRIVVHERLFEEALSLEV